MASIMHDNKDYGTGWWQRARGYIVKWWNFIYTPIYRIVVPVGETPQEQPEQPKPEEVTSYFFTPMGAIPVPTPGASSEEADLGETSDATDVMTEQVAEEEHIETEEEKQARLRSKALSELQAISDEDWKSRELEEQEKAADILVRLRKENEERERARQAELERIRIETEEKERLEREAAQGNAESESAVTPATESAPASGETEDDALLRAQEILARLQREADIDEQLKQAEIEAAKAAQS